MRNRLLWILLLLIPSFAQANLPPLTQDPAGASAVATMTAPPAVQVFQSVDDEVPPPAPPPVAAPSVQKTMPNSATVQQQALLSQDLQDLQARWVQFTQSYLLAQQENKQELALLAQKSMALQAEIEQLMTVLKTVSQQVDQVRSQSLLNQKQLNQLSSRSFVQTVLGDSTVFLNNYNNILLLLIVLILIMSWWLLRRLRKQRAKLKLIPQVHEEDDTKNEYDFMGSSEGIPAQLDLARAYIAMENYRAAESVLAQVLAKGDADQQQQAKDLIAKIPS